ncbi:Clavata3/ESR (CLE) protein [Quillaja saponaria]|uniref:Clavata3/ESR (CLE) protein n=1 Tax=Quillaja saponaria TaxID=32244 RepID=A0AAD7VMZ0_QUISA|nr:Clavata3/ESR (CLE) protein [Quillaja saponaria]
MATLSESRFLVLSLIIFTMLLLSSEARPVHGVPTIRKRLNMSELMLRELRDSLRKRVYSLRRSLQGNGKQIERMSPAGPDPEHH